VSDIESYRQIKISTTPDIAAAFKEICAIKKISMASVLSQFMADYSKTAIITGKTSSDYGTKRLRRASVKTIVQQLERIKTAEEQHRDNIPENLQNSVVYENAEQSVSWLEESIEILNCF
jgi:RPA family protein